MHLILASALCSVLVSVLLKLASRGRLDVGQMVAWNYLAASLLTAWLLHPSLDALRQPQAPWGALLGLAVVLPVLFLVLGACVRASGIVRTDVAQRLSLLLSLLAGISMPLLVVLGMTNMIAPGVAFFIAAIIGWVWLTVVVMMLAGESARAPEPALAAQS